MKHIIILLISLNTFCTSAQKDVQKDFCVFDMGLNFTGGFNYATSKKLIPKVGYTFNAATEHQFNNGNSFRFGIGHSLNGFAFDTRFLNVLHIYNLNMLLSFGKKLKNGDRFHLGATPSYAVKTRYSEIVNSFSPSKFDIKLHLTYSNKITRFVGVDFTGQLGGINIAMFGGGYMHHWSLSSKVYVRIMTKKSESFKAQ